jgi:hypothetical protein
MLMWPIDGHAVLKKQLQDHARDYPPSLVAEPSDSAWQPHWEEVPQYGTEHTGRIEGASDGNE